MNVNNIISQWVVRIVAIIFSIMLILLLVIASTPLNSMSVVVLWIMSFLLWMMYSGHELTIMFRIIFLYCYHKVKREEFISSYEQQSILDALILFKSRQINPWDGHVIPFLIYCVFTSMVFGYLTTNIYIILILAAILYGIHLLLRKWCVYIIQYSK